MAGNVVVAARAHAEPSVATRSRGGAILEGRFRRVRQRRSCEDLVVVLHVGGVFTIFPAVVVRRSGVAQLDKVEQLPGLREVRLTMRFVDVVACNGELAPVKTNHKKRRLTFAAFSAL